MSADRLERRLPEVLAELALPVMPDYVDTLLSRTERMSQRPRWSFLERWIPVSTFEATLAGRRPASLRPLIVLAIVAALIAASLAWYVGTQKRLPPLYGPARNGIVVTNNANGDIVSVDPLTGDSRTMITGPNLCCVSFSPTGQHFNYLRIREADGEPTALVIANADGSTVRELPADLVRGLQHGDWSPSGDKQLLTTSAGAVIVDVATGSMTRISVPFAVTSASWIGTSGDILLGSLLTAGATGNSLRVYRLAAGATSGATPVTTIDWAVDDPYVSPDGSKFLYFIWGDENRLHGRLHIYDLGGKTDVAITSEDANEPEHNVEEPLWSPDGSLVVAHWFFAGYDQLGVTPATGGQTLAHFGADNSTWLLPVSGEPGHKVPWTVSGEWGWQRLAP